MRGHYREVVGWTGALLETGRHRGFGRGNRAGGPALHIVIPAAIHIDHGPNPCFALCVRERAAFGREGLPLNDALQVCPKRWRTGDAGL